MANWACVRRVFGITDMAESSTIDTSDLQRSAREHLFVGMQNHAQLAEDGGPVIMDRAEGIYFYDTDGKRYIDGISGMYFRNIGYGREEVARAVYEQLSAVAMNVYSGVTPAAVRLAERLARLTPGDLSRTFFCQGGSEANESALKLAQAYHVRMGDRGRYKVISRRGSYHGATYGTMWLGDHPGFPRTDYQPKPAHVVHVPAPYFYRCEFGSASEEECAVKSAGAIEAAILAEGPDSVSAFIGEPVSQPLGGVVPHASYWPMVREICDRYGVLLIFDEVITGFGRLGEWFGATHFGVVPDIMSFAKGVTSGYFPMGGVITDAAISGAFAGGADKTWSHMYTYSTHPGGVAAALVNLDVIERERLVQNARARGEQLRERLADMQLRHQLVGDARGMGLIQGMELVKDRATKERFAASAGVNALLTAALKRRGIWIRVPAFILPLSPPLTITADELDHLCDMVDESLGEVSSAIGMS